MELGTGWGALMGWGSLNGSQGKWEALETMRLGV